MARLTRAIREILGMSAQEHVLRHLVRFAGRTYPPALTPMLTWAFTTPPRRKLRREERAFLEQVRQVQIPFEGQRLAGWTWGSGPLVYLLHGWGGSSGQMLGFGQRLAQKGFSVLTFDAPGHGCSPTRRANVVDFSKALESAVEFGGPARGLVAHSMGAAASLLALSRGLPVDRVVLLGPPAYPQRVFFEMLRNLHVPERRWPSLSEAFERRFKARWSDLEGPGLVGDLQVPLMVVHDRLDQEVPWHHGEAIARASAGSEWVLTEGLGHRRLLWDPLVQNRSLAFLKSDAPVTAS